MYLRLLLPEIQTTLKDTPVIMLTGARQVGKTTLAQQLSDVYYTFDDLDTLNAAKDDPVGFVSALPQGSVLDEIQRVPELFLPLKAAVDRDRRAGKFILTGSANVLLLPNVADTLVGRMAIFRLWPLSQLELTASPAKPSSIIDNLFHNTHLPKVKVDKTLVSRVAKGGYPEALRRSGKRLSAWFGDYLTTLIERDIRDLSRISGLTDLPKLLRLLALRSATVLSQADLARDAALNAVTFRRYFDLLQATFLVYTLPAWFINQTKRLVKAPKLHFTDTGVASYLLGLDETTLVRDRSRYGQLLESFVVAELSKQLTWSDTRAELYHYRSHSGEEVDIMIETAGGDVLGLEVKASATVSSDDFKALRSVQSVLGDKFVKGIVLYTGDKVLPFGERLWAAPVSLLY